MIFSCSVYCTVCMILCEDFLFFVFRVTFPLSLLKTWSVVHTFHTRQNNGCKKRARDKLYFSIPAQLKANFRLLINKNLPVNLFSDSSLSSPQVTMIICPSWDALCVWVCWQAQTRHTHLRNVCRNIFALGFGVVYMLKILLVSLRVKTYFCLFSSCFTTNQ